MSPLVPAWLAEALVSGLLLFGAFFLVVGSLGLAKLPDLMRRLHAPTKATTLGIGATLVASMVYFLAFFGDPSVHELLITLFLFLTAPVTAQMVAKAHLLRDRRTRQDLPPTGSGAEWATLSRPHAHPHAHPHAGPEGREPAPFPADGPRPSA